MFLVALTLSLDLSSLKFVKIHCRTGCVCILTSNLKMNFVQTFLKTQLKNRSIEKKTFPWQIWFFNISH